MLACKHPHTRVSCVLIAAAAARAYTYIYTASSSFPLGGKAYFFSSIRDVRIITYALHSADDLCKKYSRRVVTLFSLSFFVF